ncbi:hypothetical protein ZIOFF_047177 [Zingiber officinale]|uniref:Reverse transcriptase/retrotransposon-derived protein RNase H-like domain-containing protein n=1 Tax=Zingiber officinale TaxID=94328 RepID=A0A8J5KJP1_ZINOF|nr:hypothetical protein ZIOFF_047177 [Zingiber officinale]
MWIQWRMVYAAEYEALIQIAGETQNILSAIRRSFLLKNSYQGSTVEQDQAYIDIERLTCNSMKDIFNYLNNYKMLAAKSGRMFISPELYFVIDYVRKIIQESLKEQRRLQQAVLQLQKELVQNKPLTSSDIKGLVVEITKQPKLIEEQAVGYQSAKNSQPRRLSNLDIEEIRNEGEEEFAGVFTSEYALPLFHEEYDYPDTNNRWDILGEPSGKYNYYVNYAAPPPQPFIPATRPSRGDEDNTDDEAVFPSIWEDTPWEEDPDLDPNDLAPANEDEEDLESYFLGLSNLETDYPVIFPNSVLPDDNQQLPPYWDNSDTESEEYWQQVVEEVEQVEEHEGEPNDWLPYVNQDQGSSQNIQSTEEAAHVGTDSLLTEQLERMDYPILRSMMQQATTEKALSSTSAISRYNPPHEPLMGQVNYPPAQVNARTKPKESTTILNGKFRPRGYNHQPWTLPSAQTNDEAILILPKDIEQYSEVISCPESITNNLVNQKTWLDNAQKVQFIENLLGENEKKMWIQWQLPGINYQEDEELVIPKQQVLAEIDFKMQFAPLLQRLKEAGFIGDNPLEHKSHIPNLSKLLGPLYSKTSPHGDRRFKTSAWTIIKEVKALVQTLPDLELPPVDAHIIIETDGCMEG